MSEVNTLFPKEIQAYLASGKTIKILNSEKNQKDLQRNKVGINNYWSDAYPPDAPAIPDPSLEFNGRSH